MGNIMPSPLLEPAIPFSHAQIKEIEQSIGHQLPKDYSEFVGTYGGAFVGGSIDGSLDLPILAFFSADEKSGILSKLRTYQDLQKEGVLPIADCELGNLYVLDRENAIHYLNYYGGKTTARKVASSFGEFLARVVVEDE
jgi:hypothetical protein